jgi:flagellar secretion chaperone FliS
MNAKSAIRAYNNVGLESNVTAADPHKLISMLYQGALQAIANARNSILRNDIPGKGASITNAMAIIGEGLHASLDKSIGGELVQNLASLYDYMVYRLFSANTNNDVVALDEVTRLLVDLKDAWDSIRPVVMQAQTAQKAKAPAQHTYGAR